MFLTESIISFTLIYINIFLPRISLLKLSLEEKKKYYFFVWVLKFHTALDIFIAKKICNIYEALIHGVSFCSIPPFFFFFSRNPRALVFLIRIPCHLDLEDLGNREFGCVVYLYFFESTPFFFH